MKRDLNIGDHVLYDVTHPLIHSALKDMTAEEQEDLYTTKGVIIWFREDGAAIILNTDKSSCIVPVDCLLLNETDEIFTFESSSHGEH